MAGQGHVDRQMSPHSLAHSPLAPVSFSYAVCCLQMFVRLFVDENLDRMVPISRQPREKVQAIIGIQSHANYFPALADVIRVAVGVDPANHHIRAHLLPVKLTNRH